MSCPIAKKQLNINIMNNGRRNDFISQIDDLSETIYYEGCDIFKSNIEELVVQALLDKIVNILTD